MKDKDKLIIVAEVSVKGMRHPEAGDVINYIHEQLSGQFDDTVKVIAVPESRNKVPNITIRTVNSDAISPEEMDNILARAEKCIQGLVDGIIEH